MTRSEERMHVGTERREAGRARLRKYVVTEDVQQTVPVRREEVRVEREPITDDNRDAALSGPDITEAGHEVTLHEERPVTETETVQVERVRMTTEEHTDQETVRGQVRKEQIDTEGIDEDGDRRGLWKPAWKGHVVGPPGSSSGGPTPVFWPAPTSAHTNHAAQAAAAAHPGPHLLPLPLTRPHGCNPHRWPRL